MELKLHHSSSSERGENIEKKGKKKNVKKIPQKQTFGSGGGGGETVFTRWDVGSPCKSCVNKDAPGVIAFISQPAEL